MNIRLNCYSAKQIRDGVIRNEKVIVNGSTDSKSTSRMCVHSEGDLKQTTRSTVSPGILLFLSNNVYLTCHVCFNNRLRIVTNV